MLTDNQITDFWQNRFGRKPLPEEITTYKGYDLNRLGSMADPTYANVGGTIINKRTSKVFENPEQFAQEIGVDPNSLVWDKFQFDTKYDPTKQPFSLPKPKEPEFNYQQVYNEQLAKEGADAAKSNLTKLQDQVNAIDADIQNLYESKKQQVIQSGGIVNDTQLRAEVLAEKEPLLNQRASLVNQLSAASKNYNDILQRANMEAKAAQQTYQNKLAGQRVAIQAANDLMTQITNGSLDPLSLDPTELAQLEQNAGLPTGTIANLVARANFVAHSFQTDDKGNVSFVGVDKGGNVTVQNVGSIGKTKTKASASGTGSGGVVTNDIKAIAEAIISGKQPPELKGLYGKSAAVRAELQRRGYNLTKAQEDWTATQKFLSSANSTTQLRLQQAVKFSFDSLELVDSLNQKVEDALHRSGITNFAKVQKVAALQGLYGPEVKSLFTQLDNQISDLVSELATVYKGGNSSTNEGLALAAKQLSSNWDYKTLQDNVKLVRQNLQIRLNSMANSQVAGVIDNQYAPKSDTSKPTLDSFIIN